MRRSSLEGWVDCQVPSDQVLPSGTIDGALRLDCFYKDRNVQMYTYPNPAVQAASERTSAQ